MATNLLEESESHSEREVEAGGGASGGGCDERLFGGGNRRHGWQPPVSRRQEVEHVELRPSRVSLRPATACMKRL